jgi:hypothetical protein
MEFVKSHAYRKPSAPWKIANGVENLILQAL